MSVKLDRFPVIIERFCKKTSARCAALAQTTRRLLREPKDQSNLKTSRSSTLAAPRQIGWNFVEVLGFAPCSCSGQHCNRLRLEGLKRCVCVWERLQILSRWNQARQMINGIQISEGFMGPIIRHWMHLLSCSYRYSATPAGRGKERDADLKTWRAENEVAERARQVCFLSCLCRQCWFFWVTRHSIDSLDLSRVPSSSAPSSPRPSVHRTSKYRYKQ